jgi:hypothetical protein
MSRMAVVRWIADVLQHPTTGVHALLPDVPRLPDWPIPEPVPVYDETRAHWVASSTLPQTITDGLIVRRVQPTESDVLPAGNGFATVTTAIHYVHRTTAEGLLRHDVALIAEQTLLAAQRCLSLAIPQFVQPTYPMLAGVEIGQPDVNVFTHLPLQAPLENGLLLDALFVRVAAHHMWALGIDPALTS